MSKIITNDIIEYIKKKYNKYNFTKNIILDKILIIKIVKLYIDKYIKTTKKYNNAMLGLCDNCEDMSDECYEKNNMKYCDICENNSEIINNFKIKRDYKIIIKLKHFFKDGITKKEILYEYKNNEFCNINLILNYVLDDDKIYKFFVLDNIIRNNCIDYILSIYKDNDDVNNDYNNNIFVSLFFVFIELYINDEYKNPKKNIINIDEEIRKSLQYFFTEKKYNILDDKLYDKKDIPIIKLLKCCLDFEKLIKYLKYVIIK